MSNIYTRIAGDIQLLLARQKMLGIQSPILLNQTTKRCFRDLLIMIHEYKEVDPVAERVDFLMRIKSMLDNIQMALKAEAPRKANTNLPLLLCSSLTMTIEDHVTQCLEKDFTIERLA